MCIAARKLSKLAVLTLERLQGVAEAESRRAADAAEAAYQAAFTTDTPADEAALDREYERALFGRTSCIVWSDCGGSGVV